MSTELQRFEGLALGADMKEVAQIALKSGFFGSKTTEQSFMICLAAQALDVPLFMALKEVNIIEGKPELSPHGMAALIKRSPKYDYRIKTHTDELCEIEYFENGNSIGFSSFSTQDAEKAAISTKYPEGKKLADKAVYKSYSKDMMYCRAMSRGAKWHCADVFLGSAYVHGEIPQPESSQNRKRQLMLR
jgi:hypothetical protein